MAKELIWKYKIGDSIENDTQDFIITDQYVKEVLCKNNELRRYKYYKYTCRKCGYTDGNIEETNLRHGYGCSCCNGKQVVEGINDIPTTAPWMVDYFQGGYEEAKQYTCRSNKKVVMICPYCSRLTNKPQIINNLYRTHSIGCFCSDGISYSEKFISKLLEENSIDFIKELTSKDLIWCESYRYDFYLPKYNCIVETHGLQHYKDSTGWNNNTRSLEEQMEVDEYKKSLAIKNGIKKYIILDCRYSNYEYIINSILRSELSDFIDLKNYDFTNCIEFANGNLLKDICIFYEKNKYTKNIDKISAIFHLNRSTVTKYLNEGTKIGFCHYEPNDSRKISTKYLPNNIRPIKVIKDNKLIAIFKSAKETERKSLELLGTQLWHGYILSTCNKNKMYKGYCFEDMSRENFIEEIGDISQSYKLYVI